MTRVSKAARAVATGALLFATVLTVPAMAQTAKPHRAPDLNGVDLIHGDYLMSVLEGSIGSGVAELPLIRTGIWVGGGIDINGHQWDRIGFQQTVSGGLRYVVSIGPRSEIFNSTGMLPSGSSLTGAGNSFVYRDADGTTIAFSDNGQGGWGADSNLCTGNLGQASCVLIPTTISEPNGKTVDIGYDFWTNCWDTIDSEHLPCHFIPRISNVSNSFGYGIQFAYSSGGSGGGSATPPSSWFQRTGATFHNATVSGSPSQGSTSYSYPSTGVNEVTDMGGRVWRFTGTATAVTAIRRPGASSDTTTVTYGGAGSTVSSITRDGVTTSYSRSVSGSTATMTVTNALSQATTVVSNLTTGRLTSITDPLSRQTQFQYDGNARLTRVTQPEGNYIQYTYDGRGNVTETRRVAKSGSGLADIVTSATYATSCTDPSCNSPLTTTDWRGNVTDYTYDTTHGGVLTVTGPAPGSGLDRPQTRYSYTLTNGEYRLTGVSACSSGTLASSCVDTANESRAVLSYDANGNATSVERRSGNTSGPGALSAVTARTYDALGNLLTVDGPLSGTADTARFRYNAARQLVGAIGPDPDGAGSLHHRARRITYTDGLRTKVEVGTVNSQSDTDWASFSTLEEVQQAYDANARPIAQRLVSGSTTHALNQTSYDALGRAACVAQRMNGSEFAPSSLPADACTLDTEGSHGPDRITRATYDNAGQATRIETGYGVTGVTADEVSSTYRANGQVETVTDAEGNRTTYVYDGHDRLSRTRMPSSTTDNTSSTTDYEELTYDAGSNVTSRRLRDGTSIGYSYDHLDRLTYKNLPSSPWYNLDRYYGYDNLGRLTYANGNGVFTFAYDALGGLIGETSPWGTTAYQYDLAGRRTRLTWPGSGPYVDYDHLVTGEISAIRENGATSGAGVLGAYAYDDRGQRTSLTRGNGTVTSYGYDAVSRMSQLVQNFTGTSHDLTLDFSYNPAGQIASNTRSNDAFAWTGHYAVNRNYTANGLNRYSAAGSVTPSYDANGNLTAAGGPTYAYTAENVLVSASGAAYQEMMADSLERLHRYYDGSANRWLVYDGQSLIAEYGGGGTVLRRYVHGPGTDEPLVWYEGSGTSDRRWLHADERGSVIAISNGSGAVTNVNAYDESGIPASTNVGRFQYTGQQWLAEFGLQYSRARIYSPTLGRFMQTDPIGYAGGMNLHAYVLNDPINSRDPTGLCSYVDVGYGWYTPGGEYLGPAPGVYFVPKNCDGGFGWGSPGSGPTLFDAGVGPAGGNGTPGPCNTQPTSVNIDGTLVISGAIVGFASITGTLRDVSTGRSVSFVGRGPVYDEGGGMVGAGLGHYQISGTLSGGFDALSNAFQIRFWEIGIGPVSLGGASITTREGSFGNISIDGRLALPAGGGAINFYGATTTPKDSGTC